MPAEAPTGVSPDEWRAIRASTANVLAIGARSAIDRFLEALLPLLVPPVNTCAGVFREPARGSLILRDVERLSPADQQQLLDWLQFSQSIRVVSTASLPLFELVGRGAFQEVLYYRLNVITVTVGSVAVS
jgi:sigma-54-interacting transcriptional regulator